MFLVKKSSTFQKLLRNNMKSIYILTTLLLFSCSEKKSDATFSVDNNRPELSQDKKTITFPAQSQGLKQFSTESVSAKGQFVSVIAPSHVISSMVVKNGTFVKA